MSDSERAREQIVQLQIKRRLLCQEETEQDRREQEQELEWAAAAVDKDRDAWEETKLVPDPREIASAHSVASAYRIVSGHRATI